MRKINTEDVARAMLKEFINTMADRVIEIFAPPCSSENTQDALLSIAETLAKRIHSARPRPNIPLLPKYTDNLSLATISSQLPQAQFPDFLSAEEKATLTILRFITQLIMAVEDNLESLEQYETIMGTTEGYTSISWWAWRGANKVKRALKLSKSEAQEVDRIFLQLKQACGI